MAADPAPLLGLDVCSAEWLERALPVLRQADDGALTTGDRLVHRDVWAGNLCFAARGAVLVDWGSAGIGNPQLDLAMALLSIRAEGGRAPRLDFPEESAFAALLAGHNAVEAVAPLPAWASPDATLRADQLGDLRHALPWVAELLGLPPPA